MYLRNNETPILVLKLEHYGSLGIMRSLGRLGIPAYGVDGNPRPIASSSRFCRRCFMWEIEQAETQKTLEFLARVARQIGSRPIIIPTSDQTTVFVAENCQQLQEWYNFHHMPAKLVSTLCNKKEMNSLAERFGIPTPPSLFPTSRTDLARNKHSLRYPVVLKGIRGWTLEQRRGRRIAIARTPDELLGVYAAMADSGTPNIMVQEYIPAADDSAWLFNGYFNSASECVVAFTGKKIRQNPVYTGMTSLGVCLWNQKIVDTITPFLKTIGYRGIVDVDFRYDERDDRYKLLDINPRIGASFRLFAGEDGMDVARAMYLDLTNQPVPATRSLDGRTWVVEDKDLLSAYRYIRDGRLRLGQWLSSLRSVDEAGYFDRDDMRPCWHVWKGHLQRGMARLMRVDPMPSQAQINTAH